MCGIAGFMGKGDAEVLRRMNTVLAHRGPDASGVWQGDDIGLAHTRLSIIDLSTGASQPMSDISGRYHLAFNGEIYNFKALRKELEGSYSFSTHSDTEVILAAYAKWGSTCFSRFEGMFAIALYDSERKELILARDPLGKKPLYWAKAGDTFVFASEIKGLLLHPDASRTLDPRSLAHYLAREYVPTPRSIFKGVQKVMPGTLVRLCTGFTTEEIFWKPESAAPHRPFSEQEALEKFDVMLGQAVEKRLIADVPLGVFLSGGIDSSTIAYYAKQSGPVKTFSIGFNDSSFDESDAARAVAEHLGTEHHHAVCSDEEMLSLVSKIPDVFDEPVADASVLPTLLLSRFARQSVTVALGGDGADELLLGYPTSKAEVFARRYSHVPSFMREALKTSAGLLPSSRGYFSFDFKAKKFLNDFHDDPSTRHMQWLGSFREDELQKLLMPEYQGTASGLIGETVNTWSGEYHSDDAGNQLSHLYLRTYCMDDVLVKVDRASMHYGLEVRTPFLDKDLVSFTLSLPSSLKYRNGTGKYLLRKLMKERLPADILARPKHGFAPPTSHWLSGPLREMMTDLFSPSYLASQGIFSPVEIEHLMSEHLSESHDHRKKLWTLLVFQLWYQHWMR